MRDINFVWVSVLCRKLIKTLWRFLINVTAFSFINGFLIYYRYPASPFDERLKEPCLGAFGAPVDPNITLAGFTDTAYKNASTLIITYVVNNYQDENKMAEVMAWEKAFIKYMNVYVNDSSHANLTISYSTPGSVEQPNYGIEVWTYRDQAVHHYFLFL